MRDPETFRRVVVWGWLRWLLGFVQTTLALAGLLAFVRVGLHPVTWALCAGATVAMMVSRLLYHGRPAPPATGSPVHKKNDGKGI